MNCAKHSRNYVSPDQCQDCLIDGLDAMTAERDAAQAAYEDCRGECNRAEEEIARLKEEGDIVFKAAASRCAEIAGEFHVWGGVDIANTIRKEFNL